MAVQKRERELKVKVIAKRGRRFLLLRWPTADGWGEETTDIPIGDSKRARQQARDQGAILAAAKAAELDKEARKANECPTVLLKIWKTWLLSNGTAEENAEANAAKVRDFLEQKPDGIKIEWVTDITEDRVVAYLESLRKVPRARGQRKKPVTVSVRTANSYLVQLNAYCDWLLRRGAIARNPLGFLKPQSVETDRRRVRRATGPADFLKVLEAAAGGPVVECVTGTDRVAMYLVAAWTGYRRKELSRMTLRSLRFNDDPPAIQLGAEFSKNKRPASIPLHPVLVDRLKAWLAGKGVVEIDGPLFPLRTAGGGLRDTAAMMRADLKAAKLEYESVDGFADFHALRHTFITNLALAEVPIVEASRLARHGDPKITARVYTHISEQQKAKQIAKLPAPPDIRPVDPPPASLRFEAG